MVANLEKESEVLPKSNVMRNHQHVVDFNTE
jgi:hypothetical protein